MKEATIIGGGIGGPVAALALQRAGFETAVYEARPQSTREIGLFLNVASNGLDVLRTLGVDVSAAGGWDIPRLVMWSGTGKRLGEVVNGMVLPDGTVSQCVKRDELHRVLREEAAARGIPIHHQRRFVQFRDSPGHVVAEFEDGSMVTGDVLVGADGIRSRCRELLDPAAQAPSFTGLLSIGGFSRVAELAPTPRAQHLVFGRRGFFGYLVRDDGWTWWFANVAPPAEPDRDALGVISTADWLARLRDTFRDDLPLIDRVLAGTVGEVGAYPIHDVRSASTWRRGRVTLIGDAAHATSPNAGQGAAIALEDAIVVAQCLRDIDDVASALDTFENLRRARTERVVAYSRRLGGSKSAGPVARRLRDLLMPVALKRFASPERMRWLYDYHVDWERHVSATGVSPRGRRGPLRVEAP
jgi:FAD-dependent urate hydroxylase